MLYSLQSEQDLARLEDVCRDRILNSSDFSISVDGIDSDKSNELEQAIRNRLLQSTIRRIRTTFRSQLNPAAGATTLRVTIQPGNSSNRLAQIVEEESVRILELASSRWRERVDKRGVTAETNELSVSIHTLTESQQLEPAQDQLNEKVADFPISWEVGPDGVANVRCSATELGGDEICDWDGLSTEMSGKYGSAIPWKPVWRPPPPDPDTGKAQPTWLFYVKLDNPDWNTALLTISDGAPFGIGSNRALFGLDSILRQEKEMWYWNSCVGNAVKFYHPGKDRGSMDVQAIDVDMPPYPPSPIPSLLFRKPGFLGIWYDVGSFPLYHTRFARWFGGTQSIFKWVDD
jgi:hypothetical protein